MDNVVILTDEEFENLHEEILAKDAEIAELKQRLSDSEADWVKLRSAANETSEQLKAMLELNERNCAIALRKEQEFYTHCERYNGIEEKLKEALEVIRFLDSRLFVFANEKQEARELAEFFLAKIEKEKV